MPEPTEQQPATTEQQPTEQQPATTEQQPTEQQPTEQKFTQADVDRIVTERLARERKAAERKATEQPSDADKALTAADVEAAATKAREEAAAEFNSERALLKVEALASGKFADPEDAVLRLRDRSAEFIGDDGKPNADAITKALDEVLTKHPHLKAAGGTPSASDLGLGNGHQSLADNVKPGLGRLSAAYAASSATN